MNQSNKLLILTEAGEGIGYGHYSRCSALKSCFEEEMGVQVRILLDVKGAQTSFFNDVELADWPTRLHELNQKREYSHVLIDSYLAPASVFDVIKNQFTKVVALDDYGRIDEGPDLIINPNIFGNEIQYTCPAVGGPDYVILRSSFRGETRKHTVSDRVQSVLITLGGSDFRGLMPRLIAHIRNCAPKVHVHAVAGNKEYASKLVALGLFGIDMTVHGFCDEITMKELMLSSDLAISACGQTLHELAWLGVPTVGVCVANDQVLNMKSYVANSFLEKELYYDQPQFDAEFIDSVHALMSSKKRQEKSNSIRDFATNQGVQNICDEILNGITATGFSKQV